MSDGSSNSRRQSDAQRVSRGAGAATAAFPRGAFVLALAMLVVGCAHSQPSTVEMEQAYEAMLAAWPEYDAAYQQLMDSVVIQSSRIDIEEEHRMLHTSLRIAASHTRNAAEMPQEYLDSIAQLVAKGDDPGELDPIQLPDRFQPEAVEHYERARRQFMERRRAWFRAVAGYAEQQ